MLTVSLVLMDKFAYGCRFVSGTVGEDGRFPNSDPCSQPTGKVHTRTTSAAPPKWHTDLPHNKANIWDRIACHWSTSTLPSSCLMPAKTKEFLLKPPPELGESLGESLTSESPVFSADWQLILSERNGELPTPFDGDTPAIFRIVCIQ